MFSRGKIYVVFKTCMRVSKKCTQDLVSVFTMIL